MSPEGESNKSDAEMLLRPRLLELFAGTGSVGRAFRARGWDVVSVDNDPRAEATVRADVLKFKPEGHFDAIWASPPCTFYSRARGPAGTTADQLEASDGLVRRTLEIAREVGEDVPLFIENPWTGNLKNRGLLDHLQMNVVDYCRYGMPYRKRTAIWTNNAQWMPSQPLCKHDCPASVDGRRHLANAQQGPPGPCFTQRELYRIPAKLCEEIAESCDRVWRGGERRAI